MKELSIEEKAKAYDGAIEKLRSLHDNYDTVSTLIDIKEELEHIFPELKETKDERIREEILEYFQQFENEELRGVNISDWIAWLEKQNKDGKKWIYEDVYLKEKEQLYQDGVYDVLENPHKYGLEKQGDIDRRIQEEIEKQTKQQWKTERQGEQKPTDKVEQNMELTDFESALFTAFSDAWQQYLDGKEVNVAQWAKEHSTELLEVSRKEHVEWSEEDEYVYNEILKRVADKKLYEHDLEYIYKWLKSLKPQPQWKPSEEQMAHLVAAIEESDGNCILQSLYNDLKKL